MNSKLALVGGLLVVGSFAGFALTGPQNSFADKGGCPNANSANGASHANENSAHGPEKQAERGCNGAATPTPGAATPTPTPEPAADADSRAHRRAVADSYTDGGAKLHTDTDSH